MSGADIRALDRALLARIDAMMAWLGITGRAIGGEWVGVWNGVKIKVRLRGSNAGAWGAWSAVETGKGPVGIIALAKNIPFSAAIREARVFLGEPDDWLERQAQREAARTRDQAADRARRITKARQFWSERRPAADPVADSHLTKVLGFTVPAGGWPEDIAFHPPSRSLILAGRDAAGDVQFVHRVFLTIKGDNVRLSGGAKKKQTDGPMDGAAFRLAGRDDPLGPLQHGEGGETAIAAWLATGYETRCRFGVLGDSARPEPHRCNILLVDDDPDGHPTEASLARALPRWKAAGFDMLVAYPWAARRFDKSDFRDVLREAGPEAVRERIHQAAAYVPPAPPLPNGAYLRPEDTNLPAYHPPITERRDEAEYRLRLSIKSFFASSVRILAARREVARRRDDAIALLPCAAMPQDKAKLTRTIIATVAEEFGFGTKRIPRPPRQLESGSQGNGKTTLSLAEIAQIEGAFVVHKYAPTLAKAEEDLARYRRDHATEASMPAMVVRGRGAADPLADGATMCRRFGVADRIAKLGASPRKTICQKCPFKDECGTLGQEQTIEEFGNRAVFFLSREYAHLPCPAPSPDIIVPDERMTLEAVTVSSIEPEKMTAETGMLVSLEAQHTLDLLRAALKSPHSLAAIRDAGINADMLRQLHLELSTEEFVDIDGEMDDEKIERQLDTIDRPDRHHMLAVVAAVKREVEAPRTTFNAIRYNVRRNLIQASHLRHLSGIKSAAVLLLDGTADHELNERLARGKLNHNVVRMERDAEVIGTIGKRYSRQSIVGVDARGNPIRPKAAERLRREIGEIAAQFDAPLLTATLDAESALVDGGHLPADVATSHNGMTRGRNDWEDRLTAINVGAETISIEDAELLAGAFYATDPAPIVSMAKVDDLSDDWPFRPWPYRCTRLRRMRDGWLQAVQMDVHPDPRVQRVIEQIREAGVLQNLDRVRPIYNHRTLVVMDELVLDLSYDRVLRHRQLVEGGNRIERILKCTNGVLPLTPALLSALFPDLAGSASTARRAIRAFRKWGQTANRTSNWKLTSFLYRRLGQPGRPSEVLVSAGHPAPKAAGEAVLGPVAAFWPAAQREPAPAPEPSGASGERPSWTPPVGQRMPGGEAVASIWQARAPPDG